MFAAEEERRRHPRLDTKSRSRYRLVTFDRKSAAGLRPMGIAFETDEPVEPGTALELILLNKNVRIEAVVKDQTPLGRGRFRIGVGFSKEEPAVDDAPAAVWRTRRA